MSDFYLLYQPKMNDNVIVGLEALLRPVNAMQSVPEYLANVTNTVALDLMVMKLCLKDVEQHGIKIPVSINIHPTSLLNDYFVFSAIRQLKDHHIVLELVEHQDVDLNDKFINNVSLLKQNNIEISIDDFGKDFAHRSRLNDWRR
ncbi:EAL domain-containing protein [Vibrio taketomensis]|uniref:EAL domain-containing protein n=1 Tax=Vibrio taketomensis TaxID=2572923 RepID=UPI001E3D427F|nr:EAL domain-containing protein [Vibrio taketomensis]